MKIVLASNNAGKCAEFQEILSALSVELIPQKNLNVSEVEETGLTFVENAIIKARHAAEVTGLPALADDSGLAVDFLKGEPGIHSARYAGSAQANIEKLLENLKSVTKKLRKATFHCAIVFLLHAKDPTPLICQGSWSGFILEKPQGVGGFGYDPVFYVPERHCSAAELSSQDKNVLSHRGRALEKFIQQFPKKLSGS